MNIAYCATRNLYKYLEGAIKSLLEHNNVKMLYILAEDDDLPFEIPCKHKVINVRDQTYFPAGCINIQRKFTYMALMRVCLPELIRAKKVISLDVDTIVCDSLEPIWNTDLTDKWVAWCPEHKGWYRPFGPRYCNMGVAVMNLEQMRKENVTQLLVDELNTVKFAFPEQDALNLEAGDTKSVDIDVRYNEAFCTGYTDNPAVIHYAGYPDWYENRSMFRWEYLARYS